MMRKQMDRVSEMQRHGIGWRIKIHTPSTCGDGEHGSSIVMFALVLTVLLGIGALAVDVGVLFTAKAQSQNAADAGALACVGQMLSVNQLNQGAVKKLEKAATDYANLHTILSDQIVITGGDVTVDLNMQRCRVCVPRTAERNNPVATFFARIWNRNAVDVMSCATAELANARTSNCIKPWALPDAFNDANINEAYDPGEYYEQGVTSYGTDYRLNGRDVGLQLIVKQADPSQAIASGQFFPIDLPIEGSPDTGGDRYGQNIISCNPAEVAVGDTLVTENGNMVGPTRQAVEDLIARDPNAYWDDAAGGVTGSAYESAGSPRIIRVPFFDPSNPPTSGKMSVNVTNIGSLFLESIDNNGVVATRIMLATGQDPGGPPGALQFVRLVE